MSSNAPAFRPGVARLYPIAFILAVVCAHCATGNSTTPEDDDDDNSSSGGGGPGGAGGAGGGTCDPGSDTTCYTGPDGTDGVGTCLAGKMTCLEDGSGYGPCEGEVLPAEEDDCATADDEDCDGESPLCPGSAIWADAFGDSTQQQLTGLATDADGNVIIVGYFSGGIDFGGNPLGSMGLFDGFVAKLDPDGNHLWSRRFGDADEQYANAVAVDSAGDVYVGGDFKGTINFGGTDLVSAGSFDAFVVKLSASAGTQLWSKKFGDGAAQSVEAVVVDGADNVAITGAADGTLNLGGSNLAPFGGDDIFLAKYSSTGIHLFSSRFGDSSGAQAGRALAAIGEDVLVAGSFLGTVNFGGTPIQAAGGSDLFVARFATGGAHVWSKGFGAAGDQTALGVATDDSSNVVVVGAFQGSVSFGGATLTSAGGDDVFVAKLDSAGGHVWSKQYGDGQAQVARALDVDAGGNVIVVGGFSGAIDFGDGALAGEGLEDIFIARLDPSGAHLSSNAFGNNLDQSARGVSVDPNGDILVGGDLRGTIDFGSGPLASAGNFDVFVAKFAP